MNRLFKDEAAKHIGCSVSKLNQMKKAGLMDGTFYTIGNRTIYITDRLDEWINNGGELGAWERKYPEGVPLRVLR